MKTKLLLTTLAILSTNAFSETRQNECDRIGFMDKTFTGKTSTTSTLQSTRVGDSSIPENITFEGIFNVQLFNNFTIRTCDNESYSHREVICKTIDIDLAIGRGNEKFKSLFNIKTTKLDRAELLSNLLKYNINDSSITKREIALKIINALEDVANQKNIPNSWSNVENILKNIHAQGILTDETFQDITLNYLAANKEALGLVARENTKITEDQGNDILNALFLLNNSIETRTQIIKLKIPGIAKEHADDFAKFAVNFASTNGIPNSWTEFELLVTAAKEAQTITEGEATNVLEKNDHLIQKNLGLERHAKECKEENLTDHYLAIKTNEEVTPAETITKVLSAAVINAPLLTGEKEEFRFSYDGLTPVKVSSLNIYNQYSITSDEANSSDTKIAINLNGTRMKIEAPPLKSSARILRTQNRLDLNYQLNGYNPKIHGEAEVEVEFYKPVPFWLDKKIGTYTFKVSDLNTITYPANIAYDSGKTPYVKIKVRLLNSRFYNNEWSSTQEIH